MYAAPKNPTIRTPIFGYPFEVQQAGWRGFLFGGVMKTCSIEGCEKKYHARGYCIKHYTRWLTHGDPLVTENERHGKNGTSEYCTWHSMKSRCYNPNAQAYRHYDGRGITVCERWQNSFSAFYEDMGPRPFPNAHLDRIDNNGNYEPKNVRWTTCKTNIRNGRGTKLNIKKVNEIRRLYKTGKYTQKKLGEMYLVDSSQITHIVRRQQWV